MLISKNIHAVLAFFLLNIFNILICITPFDSQGNYLVLLEDVYMTAIKI